MQTLISDYKGDYFTGKGARVLADTINDYWHKRGYFNVNAYPTLRPGTDGDYDVRSNLVNGRPPRGGFR